MRRGRALEFPPSAPDAGDVSRLGVARCSSARDEAGHPTRPGLEQPVADRDPGAGPSIAPEPPVATRTDARPARRPSLLRPPDATFPAPEMPEPAPIFPIPFRTRVEPPIGYTGPSSVLPREGQSDAHFVPVEDRWRIGYPAWDRYGKGHPVGDDYPYAPGRILDPFNQNVLKGDFPITGQHMFLDISALAFSFQEFRQIPTATTPFESTARPFELNFFGRPNQFFTTNFFALSFDLFHGDAAFKPSDWQIRLTPTFNVNNLSVKELGIVSPNVLQGTTRTREFWALQEAFVETKLADTSPDYDFTSVRVGTQPFNSDFRGFLFTDINRAVRLFGTRNANRDQCNLAYFRQWEKDTNSQLNTFNDRRQNLVFANYYRQDFIFPGYTAQVSVALQPRPAVLQVRQEPLPGPARPGRRLPAAPGRRRLPRLGRRRPHRPVQHHAPVLLGPRPRQPQPAGQPAADDQRPDVRDRGVVRPRLGPVPHLVLLLLGRQQHQQQPRDRLRHDPRQPELRRRPVQLLEPPADPALRRQPGPAPQPRARPAFEQDPGPDQLRQPGPAPAQHRHRLRPHARS